MHDQHSSPTTGVGSFLPSPARVAFYVLLVIVGFYLITVHTAHVLAVLPYALVLLCPIMHFFMHRSHDGHRDHAPDRDES